MLVDVYFLINQYKFTDCKLHFRSENGGSVGKSSVLSLTSIFHPTLWFWDVSYVNVR